jgi:glycosyltransferase involved in cell wall biosynthesis
MGPIRAASAALAWRADVVHFHDPECIPLGLFLKIVGKKVIYDVHEDVPRQILGKKWIPHFLKRPVAAIVEMLEWFCGRVFDRIVVATPTIAGRFPEKKCVLVRNYPDISELTALDHSAHGSRDPIAVYIGALSEERGALEMVEAVGLVAPNIGAELHIAGQIGEKDLLPRMERLDGWKRSRYLGVLSRSEVKDLLGKARMGLVLLHPTEQYLPSLPIKMFEYMSAGIPVIASSFPLWQEILEDTGAGIIVDPRDVRAIALAMEQLFLNAEACEAMGGRGRRAVEMRFNWKSEEKKLINMYNSLVI